MAKVSRFVILMSFVQMMDDLCFVYSVTMKVAAIKILECSETLRFLLLVSSV